MTKVVDNGIKSKSCGAIVGMHGVYDSLWSGMAKGVADSMGGSLHKF